MKRIPRWFASQRAYAIGLAALILAAGVKFALDPRSDTRTPFLLLLGTVMTAAWYGGLLPGLATTLLAALVGDYLFVPAGSSFTSGHAGGAINIGLFLIEGSLISVLVSQLRTAHRNEETRGSLAERRKAETAARQLEPELETLNRLGLALAGQLDMGRLVKAVTDAGIAITGAAFGAFLYKDASDVATHYVSGAPPEAFVDFPLFQDADAFGSPFLGAVSRSDDLTRDPRYGQNLPFKQMPPGSLPARSYIAAPVRSGAGELLGGLFFGHPDPGFFHERDERLIAGLAAHAAIAADNAHLYRDAQEARAAAEAANGLKDEFLATLSHELRTPLTAIVGWAHLLQGAQLSPDENARAVDTIIRNATAQNEIIDELLDVSRIITGKLQLDLQPVDITTVVKAAIGTVTPAASAKGIRLQLIQDPSGTYVMGDPERLQQVFWNLFSNAIKFTSKNGRVRVSVESVGSNVEVVVADTGLGIDAEFLPRIFDRFTQDDSSSTRHARGLGLGLSIARQLVELHGGSIHAESPGIGQGSTFTARFPRSPVTATPLSPRVYSQADKVVGLEEGPDLTGIRVLVVEDDDDARGLVEKGLEIHGAGVKTVSSAREALEVLGKERVDVLLCDIEMPGTDGYQLDQGAAPAPIAARGIRPRGGPDGLCPNRGSPARAARRIPATLGQACATFRADHRREQLGGTPQLMKGEREVQLPETDQELREFLEHALVALSWVGPDGRILWANETELDLLGYSETEYVGHHIAESFVEPETAADILGRLAREERVASYEARLRTKAGLVKQVLIDGSGLFRDGRLVHSRLLTRDVTALIEREQAARRRAEATSHLKDEFLALLSHELRTPLGAVLVWLGLLRQGGFDPAERERALDIIERSARSLERIIEDLLHASRIAAGGLMLHPQLVDVRGVVQVAIDAAAGDAALKGLPLRWVHGEVPVWVRGDPGRLQQAVSNLLSNAIKFTPAGGQIEVSLDTVDQQARLRVADSGEGMSPAFLPFAFERFRQQDISSTRAHHGLGLGLYVVRHVVGHHGGFVSAESPGPGRGSTFTVLLPLAADPTQEARPSGTRAGQDGDRPPDGLTVLLVDDEEDAREALRLILQQNGMVVTTAGSAREAFELVELLQPDILLSDVAMPGEDGLSLIRRVRLLPPGGGGLIPAAALSAYAGVGDRRSALLAGFQHHIAKPVDPAHLLAVIARMARSNAGRNE